MTMEHDSEQRLRKALEATLDGAARRPALGATEAAEPIAITGMSCRFGGAGNVDEFWELLRTARDALQEVPKDRWDVDAYYAPERGKAGKMYTRSGYFVEGVSAFDPGLFSISGREAVYMDPQQRMLLEAAWEAIEHAGVPLATLHQEGTGTYVAAMNYDYSQIVAGANSPDLHAATGTSPSALSGRLSYSLGLEGPSITIDTACSSSLVALHLACRSLQSKETNYALVGAVNLQLTAYGTVMECASQMLAPDGRCKAYDESADGFGRGDGCGVILIKRLADALRDRDNVLAVITGSAVNHDGEGGGLSVPNGKAHERLMKSALSAAALTPDEIDFVEGHGTGTKLGDPIELQAIDNVFQTARRPSPLLVGSVKTNVGHTEAAAGMAALIKTVLMCQHDELVPNRHFVAPSSKIPWHRMNVRILQRAERWSMPGRRLRVCVNSFGLSGTNGSAIIEQHPPTGARVPRDERQALCLSAQTGKALHDLMDRHAARLAGASIQLEDYCFTANTSRAPFKHRAAFLVRSQDELREKLAAASRTEPSPAPSKPRLILLFPSHHPESNALPGAWLVRSSRAFDEALRDGGAAYQRSCRQPLADVLFGSDRHLSMQPQYRLPALYVYQHAVARALAAYGVEASAVIGYGVGQCAAAAVADVFDFETGLRLAATLGRLILDQVPDDAAPALLKRDLRDIELNEPDVPMLSPNTGDYLAGGAQSADYWATQLLRRGEPRWCVRPLRAGSRSLVIELGGADGFGKRLQLESGSEPLTLLSLFDRKDNEQDQWLSTLTTLFEAGCNINWSAYHERSGFRRTAVPTYPFQHKSYWAPKGDNSNWSFSDPLASERQRARQGQGLQCHDLPGASEGRYDIALSIATDAIIADHRLGESCVLAGSTVMAFIFEIFFRDFPGLPIRLHDLVLLKPVTIGANDDLVLHARIKPNAERFDVTVYARIASREAWQEVCTTVAEPLRDGAQARVDHDRELISTSWEPTVSGADLYTGIRSMGYQLGPAYRWLGDGWYRGREVVRRLQPEAGVAPSRLTLHPGFLDSAMQSVESSGRASSMDAREGHIYVPLLTRSLTVYKAPEVGPTHWVHTQVRETENAAALSRVADVVAFDQDKNVVVKWEGIEYRQLELDKLSSTEKASDPYYEVRWQPFTTSEAPVKPFRAVVLYTTQNADLARRQLASLAEDIIVVKLANRYERQDRLTFDSGGPQDVETLGAALSTDFPRVDAVYYDARGTATDDYEQSVLRNFYYPLQLIRAIGRAESSVKEFVFVTEGAQKAIAADRLRHGFAAMQWALARTARKEYPAVTFRLLDVPNDAGLDVLLKLRRAVDAPLEVAERNGDFYRPALVPASLSTSTTSIDPHGVYLITGGTRGVGLAIGQWLKAHGARRFILAARTVDDDVKRAVDSALGGAGIELMCVSVDLSAPQQIEQRLRSLLAGQALKGIVHAAGQQNAQRLKDFDVELARKEIDAKARSLLTLSELVDFRALDFVLCTSSITSLFGTPGAAAYGAANAFLDAYMQAFAPFNTRCHSVNFGAWSEVGMFAGLSTSLKKQFEDAGVVPMTTARGMRLLDDIFRSRSATFMAAEIDWPRLLASQPAPGPHDWLSAFRRDGATEPPAATASPPTALSLSDWQQQPASEKVGWLTARYRTLVAQTCQLDENMITTTDSMSRFGLDSVMALDLRQKVQAFCGLELSIPDILDDATIERLVDKTMDFLTASDPTFFSRKKWLASSTEQKTDWLRTLYLGLVARVCQLDIEMLSTSESMTRFGLDSIMALDIRQQIQNFCGLELAMPDILDEATIDGLVEKTRAYLDGGSQSPSER